MVSALLRACTGKCVYCSVRMYMPIGTYTPVNNFFFFFLMPNGIRSVW